MGDANFEVHRFWTTTLYAVAWPDHARHAPGMAAHFYALRERQAERIASGVAVNAKSAEALHEGEFDLFKDPHRDVAAFHAFARRAVAAAVSHVNGSQVPPERLEVRFTDSWFHITEDGGFHDAHGHGGCSWCGIYYVRAGASSRGSGGAPNGLNRFYSPFQSGGAYRDYGNAYLDAGYLDPPAEDGKLMLFPSYLTHAALPYRGAEDRIVVAFNTTTRVRPEA